jgi:hypothetical protein
MCATVAALVAVGLRVVAPAAAAALPGLVETEATVASAGLTAAAAAAAQMAAV